MVYHKKQEGWRREEPDAHGEVSNVNLFLLESDNGRDNRVATSDSPFQSRPASRRRFIALLSSDFTGSVSDLRLL